MISDYLINYTFCEDYPIIFYYNSINNYNLYYIDNTINHTYIYNIKQFLESKSHTIILNGICKI
jgi:hypothetical protein